VREVVRAITVALADRRGTHRREGNQDGGAVLSPSQVCAPTVGLDVPPLSGVSSRVRTNEVMGVVSVEVSYTARSPTSSVLARS
jgi:hypothetical protein